MYVANGLRGWRVCADTSVPISNNGHISVKCARESLFIMVILGFTSLFIRWESGCITLILTVTVASDGDVISVKGNVYPLQASCVNPGSILTKLVESFVAWRLNYLISSKTKSRSNATFAGNPSQCSPLFRYTSTSIWTGNPTRATCASVHSWQLVHSLLTNRVMSNGWLMRIDRYFIN